VLQHLYLGRDDVVLLGDHLTDARPLLAAAAGAELLCLGDFVLNANARQIVGDWFATALLALVLWHGDFILGILFLGRRRFRRDFGLVEQTDLVGGRLLRARAKLLMPRQREVFLEHFDAKCQSFLLAVVIKDERLEPGNIIGQFGDLICGLIHGRASI
jgi:hypothetical protein